MPLYHRTRVSAVVAILTLQLQIEEGGNEPWVFMIDADGRIAARWDNVADFDQLDQMLQNLPAA